MGLISNIGSAFSSFGSWVSGKKPDPTDPAAPSEPFTPSEDGRHAAGGPRDIKLPAFLPYYDFSQNLHTSPEMQNAFRRMACDPQVSASFHKRIQSVCASEINFTPYSPRRQRRPSPRSLEICDFVQWALSRRVQGGLSGVIWSILSGAFIDGWSLNEPSWGPHDQGQWLGKEVVRSVRPIDVVQDVVPELNQYKEIVGLRGLRYNAGRMFDPADFIIYSHRPLFGNPTGVSGFRAAYSHFWYKSTAWTLRMIALEKRSTPIVAATGPENIRKQMEGVLAALKSRQYAYLPPDVLLTAIDIAGGSEEHFKSAIADLERNIILAIEGASLQTQSSPATAGDQRGNTKIHQEEADIGKWFLADSIIALFNDHEGGLIRKLVDRNFQAVDGYPSCAHGGIDAQKQKEELEIDLGLKQFGYEPADDHDVCDRYGRDLVKSQVQTPRLPPEMGGPPGTPGAGPRGGGDDGSGGDTPGEGDLPDWPAPEKGEQFAEDAAGHQHKDSGPGGGQFTGSGGGPAAPADDAHKARTAAWKQRDAARDARRQQLGARRERIEQHGADAAAAQQQHEGRLVDHVTARDPHAVLTAAEPERASADLHGQAAGHVEAAVGHVEKLAGQALRHLKESGAPEKAVTRHAEGAARHMRRLGALGERVKKVSQRLHAATGKLAATPDPGQPPAEPAYPPEPEGDGPEWEAAHDAWEAAAGKLEAAHEKTYGAWERASERHEAAKDKAAALHAELDDAAGDFALQHREAADDLAAGTEHLDALEAALGADEEADPDPEDADEPSHESHAEADPVRAAVALALRRGDAGRLAELIDGGDDSPETLGRIREAAGAFLETFAESAPDVANHDDDPVDRAEALADLLLSLYGDDALAMLDALDDPHDHEDHAEGWAKWDPNLHPRGKDGRFAAKGSPEAVAATKEKVKAALKAPASAEGMADLMNHLNTLTVAQIHDLRKERGVNKVGKANRDELVRKVAERLGAARALKDYAADAGQAKPAAKVEPGKVYNLPLDQLKMDPSRFQFKLNVNKEGVTEELKTVRHWNPDFAGVISVWKDPADGATYVVNGHHRRELAGRLGVDNLPVRYIDAKDAREARGIGALINIAEGRGTSVDAAKFMRDAGVGLEDFEKRGISVKGRLAADAVALTDLSDKAFDRVTRGTLDPAQAVAVAKNLKDHARQDKLFGLLDKRQEEGKDLSPKVVEEMAKKMAAAPSAKKTEETLWGTEEMDEDTFVQQAELQVYARNELSKEMNEFAALASKRRAERTAGAGNVLKTEENRAEADRLEQNLETYNLLVDRKGAIADAVSAGATELVNAKTRKERDAVKQRTLEAIRGAVEQERAAQFGGKGPDAGSGEKPAGAAAGQGTGDRERGSPAPAGLKPPAERKPIDPEHIDAARKKLAAGTLPIKGNAASDVIHSDLSGEPIRRHVALPNGARVHPDELQRHRDGELGPENVTTKDPKQGNAQHPTFARALASATAIKGHDEDRVTLTSPHGYTATKTRGEWRDVAAGHKGGSMGSWYDHANPPVESERAKNSTAHTSTMAGEEESADFFQPDVQQLGSMFDYKTPALGSKPKS